ncbi:MAG: ATP-grasp domain-containing protein [Myxococcales bacterium]|nr:ATP-grasp domain-containing protein [Myxococcales bacterium]
MPAAAEGQTILCLSSYFKGNEFIEQCKREGWRVVLLTQEHLLDKPWARQFIDEVFALPSFQDRKALVNAVSYLARTRPFSRITPLDDYDVETAAHLREHMRIPGMGETTARYFRDKLAMRERALARHIPVPEFVHVLNDARVREFFAKVPPPWLLKPRSQASSSGIKRFDKAEDALAAAEALGDERSHHLFERMIPGSFYHVDSIVSGREVVFAEAHAYRTSLLDVVNTGGIFASRTLDRGGELSQRLLAANRRVIEHLGLVRGVTHCEYVLSSTDDEIYFVESAARVGGAHIADLVAASTGVNLWHEWAQIELAQGEAPYALPGQRHDYAGIILSLSRQAAPDTSAYTDPEIVWRLTDHANHVGLIVRAPTAARVHELIESYVPRIAADFMAVLPPPPAPTS